MKKTRKHAPRPWSSAPLTELSQIRGICLDIDDTLSTDGKLTAQAYQALWDLHDAGFAVVPITGRPAGWCDHIARFWPVDAVIGENGAFTFFLEGRQRKRMNTPTEVPGEKQKKQLQTLARKILKTFPNAKWASDQTYREFDLAIDICEDVPPWSAKKVTALLQLCQKLGAHAKLSSIHVNTWYGDYDKRKGFLHWLSQGAPGCKKGAIPPEEWIFVGDSPNDAPLFASFSYSVGVANLKKYLPQLERAPLWITKNPSGLGFTEVAQKLIQSSRKTTTPRKSDVSSQGSSKRRSRIKRKS